MITWTRLGFLGFMIPLAFWGVAAVCWGSTNFKAYRVAFVLAAIAVWFIGKKLNSEAQANGEEAPHKAFGFPMQSSGVVVSAIFFVLTFA